MAAPALTIGSLHVDPPVVLAPMAGVTNVAYRTLCRRHGGGLYVSEMVGARALIEGDRKSALKAAFAPDESPRSIQLYGVSAEDVRGAVELLADEGRVDHIDLNFGCPAPKVTRHGGGAALPWRLDRYTAIIRGAIAAAGDLPITVKLRKGIDDEHLTYLEAGRIAADLGVAAIALHGRTARERYGPPADWSAITRLVQTVDVPVLGNGDIWEAADALRMMRETGCAGVVVGRGCLGRPWLFRDLEEAFAGRAIPTPPNLGEICDLILEHAELLVEWYGDKVGLREMRKHTGWYLQGFPIGGELRRQLNLVVTMDELDGLLAGLDRQTPFNEAMRRQPRGHTTTPRRVPLPDGWLDSREDIEISELAGVVVSGG